MQKTRMKMDSYMSATVGRIRLGNEVECARTGHCTEETCVYLLYVLLFIILESEQYYSMGVLLARNHASPTYMYIISL